MVNSSVSPKSRSDSLIARLTSETLNDRPKLKMFLSGMKVAELHEELKQRGISYSALSTKALLVAKLLDSITLINSPVSSPLPHPSQSSPSSLAVQLSDPESVRSRSCC